VTSTPIQQRNLCIFRVDATRTPPADQSGGDPNQRGGIPPRRAFASDRDQPGSAIEYPTVYHKNRSCRHEQPLRPGEREERMKERDGREFLAPQGSPFFDIWASAGIDKTLSALYDGWRQLSEASRLWLAPPRCPCHFYGAIPASTGAVEPSGSVDLTGSR